MLSDWQFGDTFLSDVLMLAYMARRRCVLRLRRLQISERRRLARVRRELVLLGEDRWRAT